MTGAATSEELVAEMILEAAGSGLRHYTPKARAEILQASRLAIDVIRRSARPKAPSQANEKHHG